MSADDHVMSHDSDTFPTLPTALRLSIAGETLDQHVEVQLSSEMEESPTVEIPDDMPVDLRVKLAISMIQLGKAVPEVGLYSCKYLVANICQIWCVWHIEMVHVHVHIGFAPAHLLYVCVHTFHFYVGTNVYNFWNVKSVLAK